MNSETALEREHEREVFSNIQPEEPGRAASDVPSTTKGEPGAQDKWEREDQEIPGEKPSETPVRAVAGNDHGGDNASDAVQPDGSSGGCRCFDGPAALTDPD